MVDGTGEISASMDIGDAAGHNQRPLGIKKPAINPKEVKAGCENVIRNLQGYHNIGLVMEPLEAMHPLYNDL